MKRLALALIALIALGASAGAQTVTNPLPPQSINGAYNSSPPTCLTGTGCWLQTDVNGNLLVSASGTPAPPVGTSNLSISQVSIATSDTLAIAARATRRAVTIQNITGTQQVYCNQSTATASNGVLLPATIGSSFTFNTTSAVRCTAITSAQTVAVVETY